MNTVLTFIAVQAVIITTVLLAVQLLRTVWPSFRWCSTRQRRRTFTVALLALANGLLYPPVALVAGIALAVAAGLVMVTRKVQASRKTPQHVDAAAAGTSRPPLPCLLRPRRLLRTALLVIAMQAVASIVVAPVVAGVTNVITEASHAMQVQQEQTTALVADLNRTQPDSPAACTAIAATYPQVTAPVCRTAAELNAFNGTQFDYQLAIDPVDSEHDAPIGVSMLALSVAAWAVFISLWWRERW